jgi:CubicO group peptidase (beta-lactamase class C family)
MKRQFLFLEVITLLAAFSFLLLIPTSWAADPAKGGFDPAWQGFKTAYENVLKENGIVGSSVMVIHDNKVIGKDFYGLANIEKDRKVDEETIYHWASITKTLTGIAIMQLRDRGLLKLDDPIIKYLPELREVHDPYGDMSEITIRHLLTHSSGFQGPTWPWRDKDWQPHEPLHWSQLVSMFPYMEIQFKPGSKWSYSNPGIIYLGRVIEELTTDDFEVYIDKNIFKPLEMYRSYFDHTPYHLWKYRCQSYFLKDGKLTPGDPDVNTGITVSNGGWNAPLPDVVKLLNFLVGDPSKQEVYEGVLKRSSLEEMFKPQIEISREGNDKSDAGLIFFIEEHNGMRFIGHSGGQVAFVTHIYFHPESRTASVVAYNTLSVDPQKGTRFVDRTVEDYLFKNIYPIFAGVK